jgi:hypothetical protein
MIKLDRGLNKYYRGVVIASVGVRVKRIEVAESSESSESSPMSSTIRKQCCIFVYYVQMIANI